MTDMRHAGVHWPANAGGEHPSRDTIYRLPGVADGALLMVADSARFWYDEARKRCPLVVWRGLPRPDRLPAKLGWDTKKVADECVNLWSEQPHHGREWFVPLNELQFPKESGENWRGYTYMVARLAPLRVQLQSYFASLGQDVGLMFPAWVPSDDGDHLDEWRDEAKRWQAICVHCYGSAEAQFTRYQSYRYAFPGMPIFVGEHNANHEGHDERAILEMWAEVAETDPDFMGAAYFIWETRNAGEGDLSVWGNDDRLRLLQNPPASAAPPESEPVPDPPPVEEPPIVTVPPTVEPFEFWTAEQIAEASGCPVENVREHWPRIVAQLALCGIADRPVQAAMIGTVAIESASTFAPVVEAFWLDDAWRQAHLRYAPFWGRGEIQLTWESNYRLYSQKLDALWGDGAPDLIENPDNALDPDVSAAVAALFFRDTKTLQGYGIVDAARAGDWEWVRRLVQGGTAGLDRLTAIAAALGGAVPPGYTGARSYGPDVPDSLVAQQNQWTCAVRSTYAALWAMTQEGDGLPVTYGDIGPRDVYEWLVPQWDGPGIGLLDHTGAGLAEALRAHGYAAQSAYPVTLAEALDRAGSQPVLLGGDAWNHWVYVRGRTDDGGLVLENPSPGYQGVSDYLRDSWGRLGPMAMVWIDLVPVEQPPEPGETMTVDADRWQTLVSTAGYLKGDLADRVAALAGKNTADRDERDAVAAEMRRAGTAALA